MRVAPGRRLLIGTGAQLLLCLHLDPDAEYSDLARFAGIDERTVTRTLQSLEDAGYLSRSGRGRAMEYTLHLEAPIQAGHARGSVGELLAVLAGQ